MKCVGCRYLNSYDDNGYYFCLRYKYPRRISEKEIIKDKKCDKYAEKEKKAE